MDSSPITLEWIEKEYAMMMMELVLLVGLQVGCYERKSTRLFHSNKSVVNKDRYIVVTGVSGTAEPSTKEHRNDGKQCLCVS